MSPPVVLSLVHPVSLPHTIVPKHSDNSAVLPLKSVERAVVIQIPPGQPGPPVQRAVEQEPKHERIAVMVKPKLKHVILNRVFRLLLHQSIVVRVRDNVSSVQPEALLVFLCVKQIVHRQLPHQPLLLPPPV